MLFNSDTIKKKNEWEEKKSLKRQHDSFKKGGVKKKKKMIEIFIRKKFYVISYIYKISFLHEIVASFIINFLSKLITMIVIRERDSNSNTYFGATSEYLE